MNLVANIVLAIGIIAFVYILFIDQNLYQGLAVFLAMAWSSIFVRYFGWALYFFNINYGWTDRDWERYQDALARRNAGEYVSKEELNAPKKNPYRSQSFGLPTGTVRGMIALSLLFGALSMLLASFGKDGNIDSNSFFWDHFEFFKTAFLMMIAFYFGDKSLKHLQSRSNAAREQNFFNRNKTRGESTNQLDQDDDEFDHESGDSSPSTKVPAAIPQLAKVNLSSIRKTIANSEADGNPSGLVPIIDAGHGGIDAKLGKGKPGNYVTAPAKMYDFQDDAGNDLFSIYEGDINRKIAQQLMNLLDENGIKYYEQTVSTAKDISLADRVGFANNVYRENRNTYFLSIHSNAAGVASPGTGTKATGFEIYTSIGQTKSDELADIASKWYKKEFKDFKFRQDMLDGDEDKEANFYVLRNTACPAFLVENLFFDNKKEAEFLLSPAGQERIARCLFNIVREIYESQNNGILA